MRDSIVGAHPVISVISSLHGASWLGVRSGKSSARAAPRGDVRAERGVGGRDGVLAGVLGGAVAGVAGGRGVEGLEAEEVEGAEGAGGARGGTGAVGVGGAAGEGGRSWAFFAWTSVALFVLFDGL